MDRPTFIWMVHINKKQIKLESKTKIYSNHCNIRKQKAYISCHQTELDTQTIPSSMKKYLNQENSLRNSNRIFVIIPTELKNSPKLLKKHVLRSVTGIHKECLSIIYDKRSLYYYVSNQVLFYPSINLYSITVIEYFFKVIFLSFTLPCCHTGVRSLSSLPKYSQH